MLHRSCLTPFPIQSGNINSLIITLFSISRQANRGCQVGQFGHEFCLFTGETLLRLAIRPFSIRRCTGGSKVLMVGHLSRGQKLIILSTSILLLVSFSFPPWVGVFGYRNSSPLYDFLGYKFILKPSDGVNVSIDFSRLILQAVVILFIGAIVFCAFTWLGRANNAAQLNTQSSPLDNAETNTLARSPSTTSRFKTREEYEKWKDERSQSLSKKENRPTVFPNKTPIRLKEKSFSWKSMILATVIASVLVSVVSGGEPKPKNIGWTILWIYFSIEGWRYWRWKTFIPYPAFIFTSACTGLLIGSIGGDKAFLLNGIIKGGLNIGGLIIFFLLLRKSKGFVSKGRVVRENIGPLFPFRGHHSS